MYHILLTNQGCAKVWIKKMKTQMKIGKKEKTRGYNFQWALSRLRMCMKYSRLKSYFWHCYLVFARPFSRNIFCQGLLCKNLVFLSNYKEISIFFFGKIILANWLVHVAKHIRGMCSWCLFACNTNYLMGEISFSAVFTNIQDFNGYFFNILYDLSASTGILPVALLL